MNGLDKIIEKILDAAKADAADTAEAARAEAEVIISAAKADAASVRAAKAAASRAEGDSIRARAESSAATKRRAALLSARAAAIDEVYSEALRLLLALPDEDYRRLLCDLLGSALNERIAAAEKSAGEGEATVAAVPEAVFSAADREKHGKDVVDSFRRKRSGSEAFLAAAKSLVLSERSAPIDGGVILVWGDIEVNCSLGLLIEAMRDDLDPTVNAIINGDGGKKGEATASAAE